MRCIMLTNEQLGLSFQPGEIYGLQRIIYVLLEFCMRFENVKYPVGIIPNRLSDRSVICLCSKC
jgi:hypothetical protein